MNVTALDIAYGSPAQKTGTGVANAAGTRTFSVRRSTGPRADEERLLAYRKGLIAACHEGHPHPSTTCRCFAEPYGVHPDLVAMEGFSFGSVQAAHAVGGLGMTIRLRLYELAIPFIVIPPSSVKVFATGKGSAGKDEMFAAAIRRLGYEGNSKDQCDALWIYHATMAALDLPLVQMPQAHLKALIPIRKAIEVLALDR